MQILNQEIRVHVHLKKHQQVNASCSLMSHIGVAYTDSSSIVSNVTRIFKEIQVLLLLWGNFMWL